MPIEKTNTDVNQFPKTEAEQPKSQNQTVDERDASQRVGTTQGTQPSQPNQKG